MEFRISLAILLTIGIFSFSLMWVWIMICWLMFNPVLNSANLTWIFCPWKSLQTSPWKAQHKASILAHINMNSALYLCFTTHNISHDFNIKSFLRRSFIKRSLEMRVCKARIRELIKAAADCATWGDSGLFQSIFKLQWKSRELKSFSRPSAANCRPEMYVIFHAAIGIFAIDSNCKSICATALVQLWFWIINERQHFDAKPSRDREAWLHSN